MPWRETLCKRLTEEAAALLLKMDGQTAAALREIRFRLGRKTELVFDGRREDVGLIPDREGIEALLAALCGYSRYAYEAPMAQGYIPLPGGHRAGVCGFAASEAGQPLRMSAVTSICIRIAHDVPGASAPVRRFLMDGDGRILRALVLGPPGCGKTTVLRDAALWLSDECGLHVCAADERGELFPREPEGGRGRRLDVLTGAEKPIALMTLLRAMAPQVIVTDEIGRNEDVNALLETARCGIGLLASAHADGMDGVLLRPALRTLYDARAFDRYILLGGRGACRAAWDALGRRIDREEEGKENRNGQLGCSADGDDRPERHGLPDRRRGEAACAVHTVDAQMPASHERSDPL